MTKARLVVTAAIAVAALSGCYRVETLTTLYPDNTASQELVFAVSDALIELSGESPEALLDEFADADAVRSVAEQVGAPVTVEQVREDGWVGQRFVVGRMDLDRLADVNAGAGPTTTIVRDGDTFRVDIPADQLADQLDGDPALDGMSAQDLASVVTIRVSVTFPGAVLDHKGGTVDGHTITWEADDLLGGEALFAVGEANAPSGGFLAWLLPLVGGLALAGLVTWLVLQDRRVKAARAEAPADAPASAASPTTTSAAQRPRKTRKV